jgi:hypothetical protein
VGVIRRGKKAVLVWEGVTVSLIAMTVPNVFAVTGRRGISAMWYAAS